MNRYLKYFTPVLIVISEMLLLLYYPELIPYEYILAVYTFNYACLLFSIYWTIGFWVPQETKRTIICIALGILTLFVATNVANLLFAVLTPFILFAGIGIRKYYS